MRARHVLGALALTACGAPSLEEHAPTVLGVTPPADAAVAAAPAPRCLARPALVEVGDDPVTGLAAGDLTGDGVADLAVLQDHARGKGYVTVLTVYAGDGDGGFRAGKAVEVGKLVVSVRLGDVDGDGRVDAVVARYREKDVAVLRNTGGGRLAAPRATGTTRKPTHVELDDLDGDGDLDLVVATQGHVQAFLGDGGGGFRAGKAVAVGQAPDWPVTTDLDRDGLLDLYAPMNDDGTFYALHATAAGAWKALAIEPACASPTGPRAGDLDGDGVRDVAYACGKAPGVEVRLGRGEAVATVDVDDAAPTEALELGDFTGDGALDLVTMGRADATSPSELRLHAGRGDGGFDAPLRADVDGRLSAPVVVDLDGDGAPELVASLATGHPPARIAVYRPLLGECR